LREEQKRKLIKVRVLEEEVKKIRWERRKFRERLFFLKEKRKKKIFFDEKKRRTNTRKKFPEELREDGNCWGNRGNFFNFLFFFFDFPRNFRKQKNAGNSRAEMHFFYLFIFF
jgi:hypothetical protein